MALVTNLGFAPYMPIFALMVSLPASFLALTVISRGSKSPSLLVGRVSFALLFRAMIAPFFASSDKPTAASAATSSELGRS